jgi:triacylglycerol esterase/lipase EstA (alpha/beta hydrolase family)
MTALDSAHGRTDNQGKTGHKGAGMRLLAALIALAVPALVAATQAPATAVAQARVPLPVTYNPFGGVAQALVAPNSSPPGANDWSCRPSSAHPFPVVLVPGTFADMADDFNSVAPLLYDYGYCVFALNYGGTPGSPIQSIGDIATSAGQLASFVGQVLTATGASKVDIVGHSQGGMMPRYYIDFLGGAAKVHTLVGLAPSSHGTTLDGLVTLVNGIDALGLANSLVSATCEACVQQEVGSAFLAKLNAGGDTVAGVTYTVIETKYDTVVTPYKSAFLSGSGVTNITLQNQCFLDFTDHIGIAFDPIALTDMLNALDPAHHIPVPCFYVGPAV